MGVHPNYVESEAIKTASGRFINRNDVKERRKVIILHKKSAEILFGKSRTEPVGRFVNAGGVAYRVVGLYEDQETKAAWPLSPSPPCKPSITKAINSTTSSSPPKPDERSGQRNL